MFSKKGGNVRIGKFEFTDVGRLRKSSRRLWTIFVREEVWDNNLNDSQNIYLRVLSFSSMYRAGEMRRMEDELESKSDNRLVA